MSSNDNYILNNFKEILNKKKRTETTTHDQEISSNELEETVKSNRPEEHRAECDEDKKHDTTQTKPRESVFKRPIMYNISSILGDVSTKSEKKMTIADMIMQSDKDTNEDKEIAEKTVEKERHSTNKSNVLKYLAKKKSDSNLQANEEKSKLKEDELTPANPNIDTQPRKSVRQIINENEMRLKKLSLEKERDRGNSLKKINTKTRNTTTTQSGLNSTLKDLRKFIKLHNADNNISSEEFYQMNKGKLTEFGITNEKDFLSVQDLINYYENSLSSNRSNSMENLHSRKKRNTVSGNSFTMPKDVSEIIEENEEDANSFERSLRRSDNRRKSGNKVNKPNERRKSDNISNASCSEESFISADNLEQELLTDEIEKVDIKLKDRIGVEVSNGNTKDKEIISQTNEELEILSKGIEFNAMNKARQLTVQVISTGNSFTVESEPRPNRYKSSLIIDQEVKELSLSKTKKEFNHKMENINFTYSPISSITKPEQSSITSIFIQPTIRSFKSKLKFDAQISQIYEGVIKPKHLSKECVQNLNIHPKNKELNLLIENKVVDLFFKKLSNQINKSISLQIDSTKHITETNSPELIPAVQNNNRCHPFNQPIVESEDSPFFKNKLTLEGRGDKYTSYDKGRNSLMRNPHIRSILIKDDISSTYQKNIISSLDTIAIAQYTINKNIPLDPSFFDVLCTNCYECVKLNDMDRHSQMCVVQDEFAALDQEEDYNTKIFKLHESLKAKHLDIYSTKDKYLISIYEELTNLVYEILINNNSIEELDRSVSKINHIINNKLSHVTSNLKFSLLIYGKRVSQLVYVKLVEMEKIMVILSKYDDSDDDVQIESEEVDPEHIKYMKQQLTEIENQTMKAELELKHWRKEAKMLESNLRRPIHHNEILSEIVSDVVSRRNESFDQMTLVSNFASETNDIANMKDVNDINDDEESKKYFLSLGLSLKFKYSDKIKGNVSIADLYEKGKAHNIPISNWHEFIASELNIKLN